MPIDHSTLLFFDASALIAAAGSPRGGSGFLLELCQRGFLKAAVSHPVLVEAERNVREKLKNHTHALPNYFELLIHTPFEIASVPLRRDRARYVRAAGEKDEHVLAAAVASGAPFLVTLDQPLETSVNAEDFGLRALPPGAFIKNYLPLHPDFRRMR